MPPNASCCVIVVDDDPDDLFMLEQAFHQHSPGCQVKLLETGPDLLSTLASEPSLPSLVVLDLNMPRMSGLETLGHVRQALSSQELPIVLFTTSDQAEDRRQAQQLAANDFITKPATIREYQEVVLRLQRDWLIGRCLPPD